MELSWHWSRNEACVFDFLLVHYSFGYIPWVSIFLGPLANAAFGEGGKVATAVGSSRVLVNCYGHLVLALLSVSCADLLEGDGGANGWMGAHSGYQLSEELLITPPLFKSM